MKLNQKLLKEMVRHALVELDDQAKMKTSQQTAASYQQRKDMVKGGINDQERAAINTLTQKLAAAAKKGNILSGTLKRRLEILAAEIDKFLGDAESRAPQQNQQQDQQDQQQGVPQ